MKFHPGLPGRWLQAERGAGVIGTHITRPSHHLICKDR
jgi:hypothetical protein